MLTEHTYRGGDVPIHYAEGPNSGPPLILVHGITNNWRGFLPLLPELILRWRVLVPDLRGHGHSGHTPGHYALSDLAGDISNFARDVAGEPAMLYGHSLGGATALHAAAHQPDLYRAVLLGDPPLDPQHLANHPIPEAILPMALECRRRHNTIPALAAALAAHEVRMPGLEYPVPYGTLPGNNAIALRAYASSLLLMDPALLEASLQNRILPDDLRPMLSRVTGPFGIIQADPQLDGLIRDETAAELLAAYPFLQLVRLKGAWHILHAASAEPVGRVIRQFFETARLETTLRAATARV